MHPLQGLLMYLEREANHTMLREISGSDLRTGVTQHHMHMLLAMVADCLAL